MKCCACSQRVAKGRIAANESDKREDRRYHSVKSRAMFRHSLPIGFLILRTPLHFKKLSTRDIGIPLKIRTRHRQFDGGWPEGGGGAPGAHASGQLIRRRGSYVGPLSVATCRCGGPAGSGGAVAPGRAAPRRRCEGAGRRGGTPAEGRPGPEVRCGGRRE